MLVNSNFNCAHMADAILEVHTLMALAIKAKQWVGPETVASSARQDLAQRIVGKMM